MAKSSKAGDSRNSHCQREPLPSEGLSQSTGDVAGDPPGRAPPWLSLPLPDDCSGCRRQPVEGVHEDLHRLRGVRGALVLGGHNDDEVSLICREIPLPQGSDDLFVVRVLSERGAGVVPDDLSNASLAVPDTFARRGTLR